MATKGLLERYAAGERDFSGITIKYANFILADLKGIDLSNARMNGIKLIGANLDGANLSGARLEGADLTSADLSRANLTSADLSGCQLVRTNFCEANLSDAGFWNACIDGAMFIGANLQRAKLVELYSCLGTNFTRADLRECRIEGTYGSRCFESANLLGAIEFIPNRTDIFCKTIMPDGSIRNDGCWPAVAELS